VKKLAYFVRRAAGTFLLVILALLILVAFRLALPNFSQKGDSTLQEGTSSSGAYLSSGTASAFTPTSASQPSSAKDVAFLIGSYAE
jgi:hypothetical protein